MDPGFLAALGPGMTACGNSRHPGQAAVMTGLPNLPRPWASRRMTDAKSRASPYATEAGMVGRWPIMQYVTRFAFRDFAMGEAALDRKNVLAGLPMHGVLQYI